MRRLFLMKGLAFLVIAPLFVAGLSYIVMTLWNAVIPGVFSLPVIGFWQAAGLLVLCRILFGGFRPHGHGWRHRGWYARWHRMTPEERERFRDNIKRWKQMSWEERREYRRSWRGCGGRMGDDLHGPKEI